MEFSTLTLQERERLAYIAGETKLAKMLAEHDDMQYELEEAERTISSMQSELDQS
jgi:hypothetical protein